jgi:hypothetical protein
VLDGKIDSFIKAGVLLKNWFAHLEQNFS